jgi:cobaltochelatase CobN
MFKILFIFSGHDSSYPLREAWIEIKKTYPGEILLQFMDTYKIDRDQEEFEKCRDVIKDSDLLFISMHGGITYFKSFDGIMAEFEGKKKFFIYLGVEDENVELLKKSGIGKEEYDEILRYYLMGGTENNMNMILYMATIFGKEIYPFEAPKPPCWEGVYYAGKPVKDYKEYIHQIRESGKPIAGILFYSKYLHENNTRHIDALIKEIELLGGQPLEAAQRRYPVFARSCLQGMGYRLQPYKKQPA